MAKKSKAQIEQERLAKELKWAEAERKRQQKERERARKREEAERRKRLRIERSRPRIEMPSEYPGETIYVHEKIYTKFMRDKRISITSHRVAQGKLILEYTTAAGGRGAVELCNLGPMPSEVNSG
ncbi:hypothetical protein [Brevibacillus agri]|uniref:hypothetical protein n=1 Tax=Brevibacillus agri TaxID=51101 RepID=UPI0018CF173A|nr:hypothetical protein [Brevibacillus agri]MBG9567548.1 hypothetical protein [Brevibacillus agri]MBG9567609.1 hypothetical protein [Brevibacillus agri]MBY0054109.1 hypothetical protein [Brevibacillus agri]